MAVIGWKVFEERDGLPTTLFHGQYGSKVLKLDKWHSADVKLVRDGSGNNWYYSGFHVFSHPDGLAPFISSLKITEGRYISQVQIASTFRTKMSSSNEHLILVEFMRIPARLWAERITLDEWYNSLLTLNKIGIFTEEH